MKIGNKIIYDRLGNDRAGFFWVLVVFLCRLDEEERRRGWFKFVGYDKMEISVI